MNFIRAKLEKENSAGGSASGYVATFGDTRLPLSKAGHRRSQRERNVSIERYANEEVVLGIRPEHIEDSEVADDIDTSGRQRQWK